MKTAIICYSFTHNNLTLASEILSRTGGTLFVIEEKKARSKFTILFDLMFNRAPEIKDYLHLSGRFDHYILVAPIWGGRIASPLRSFVQKERSKIRSYSFITICGGGGANQKRKITKELSTLLQKEPLKVMELPLKEYSETGEKGVMHVQINRDQLQFFDTQITRFVEAIGAAVGISEVSG
jgi:hypothetical protein